MKRKLISRVSAWIVCLKVSSAILCVLVTAAMAYGRAQLGQTTVAPPLPHEDAVLIAEAYHLWQSLGEKVWTGWTAVRVPFMYVTADFEYAIDFPKPLEGFTKLESNPELGKPCQARKRVLSAQLSASFPYEGIDAVVIGTPKALEKSPTAWVLTASHEMFHVLQGARGERQKVAQLKIGPENDPGWQLDFPFPYKDPDVMRLIHLQSYPIYLATTDKDEAALKYNAGTAADAIRVYRTFLLKQSGDNKVYNYSQFQELNEGIAFYTEYKMAEASVKEDYQPSEGFKRLPDYKSYRQVWDDDYLNRLFLVKHAGRAAKSRTAFYHLGMGKGLLLDRLMPDWKTRYFAPTVWLDDLVFAALGQPSEVPVLTAGAGVPDFNLVTTSGESVSLEKYRGKVVMIDFWQTWCLPCVEELPHLRALQAKYRNQGLVILGIVGKADKDDSRVLPELMRENKIDYPILIDEKGMVASQYSVSGYPHVFVIDRKGKLAFDKLGYQRGEEEVLEKEVRRTLAGTPD